jgi:invasion protein IalB
MAFRAGRALGKMAARPMAIRTAAGTASMTAERDPYYYHAEPERRWLVPLLSGVAVALALAVLAVVGLYTVGFFDPGPEVAAIGSPAPVPPRPLPAAQPPATTEVPRAVAAGPPADEPPVRSMHGDWQIRCDTPPGGGREQCVLMQFVTAEDRDNVGLTVIVLKTADKQSRIMRILAPLGVLLTSGLTLKIDQSDVGKTGFVRCVPNGCVAEVMLEDQLLAQLGSGKTATFIFFQTPEEGIGIPISLTGFQAGFATLP